MSNHDRAEMTKVLAKNLPWLCTTCGQFVTAHKQDSPLKGFSKLTLGVKLSKFNQKTSNYAELI
jgi:hypothetical protein